MRDAQYSPALGRSVSCRDRGSRTAEVAIC